MSKTKISIFICILRLGTFNASEVKTALDLTTKSKDNPLLDMINEVVPEVKAEDEVQTGGMSRIIDKSETNDTEEKMNRVRRAASTINKIISSSCLDVTCHNNCRNSLLRLNLNIEELIQQNKRHSEVKRHDADIMDLLTDLNKQTERIITSIAEIDQCIIPSIKRRILLNQSDALNIENRTFTRRHEDPETVKAKQKGKCHSYCNIENHKNKIKKFEGRITNKDTKHSRHDGTKIYYKHRYALKESTGPHKYERQKRSRSRSAGRYDSSLENKRNSSQMTESEHSICGSCVIRSDFEFDAESERNKRHKTNKDLIRGHSDSDDEDKKRIQIEAYQNENSSSNIDLIINNKSYHKSTNETSHERVQNKRSFSSCSDDNRYKQSKTFRSATISARAKPQQKMQNTGNKEDTDYIYTNELIVQKDHMSSGNGSDNSNESGNICKHQGRYTLNKTYDDESSIDSYKSGCKSICDISLSAVRPQTPNENHTVDSCEPIINRLEVSSTQNKPSNDNEEN
ncbi:hypothetical protein COBT_001203 [Conglomerata obtusa]